MSVSRLFISNGFVITCFAPTSAPIRDKGSRRTCNPSLVGPSTLTQHRGVRA